MNIDFVMGIVFALVVGFIVYKIREMNKKKPAVPGKKKKNTPTYQDEWDKLEDEKLLEIIRKNPEK